MEYYELGDLTHYIIDNFFKLDWLHKLNKLLQIICGLENLHQQGVIHRDYHSGNIFIAPRDNAAKDIAMTGDLGISKSAIEEDDDEIYGIIPYVAPEIFQGHKYTKASDIYSFGMIMWELMTGRRPFWDQNHDTDLIIKICDGYRPLIITNAPRGYVELMQACWHSDPNKRPIADDIYEALIDIKNNEYKYPTKVQKLLDGLNNPGAVYKSRSLSAMIKSVKYTRSLKSQKITPEISK